MDHRPTDRSATPVSGGQGYIQACQNRPTPVLAPEEERRVAQLPPHLGWGSAAATAAYRAALARQRGACDLSPEENSHSQIEEKDRSSNLSSFEEKKDKQEKGRPSPPPRSIKIFGHLLDLMQRRRLVGQGRVWLLLRAIDSPTGEGRVRTAHAAKIICDHESQWGCLSNKRLRQILNQGEGTFWHRSADRKWIYYYSESRVAHHLGLSRIRGWAVEVKIEEICGPIAAVRSLFYDAFHSARGDRFNHPITRQVMTDRGSGDGRTQRKYEALRQIERRANYASLGRYEKRRWHQLKAAQADPSMRAQLGRVGGPLFIYIDYKGVLGKNYGRVRRTKGKRHWHNIYMMRQIGNAYAGTLKTVKRGRGWTNFKLKNLCQSMRSVKVERSDYEMVQFSAPTGSILAEGPQRPVEPPQHLQKRFYHSDQNRIRLSTTDRSVTPLFLELGPADRFEAERMGDSGSCDETASGYWSDLIGLLHEESEVIDSYFD